MGVAQAITPHEQARSGQSGPAANESSVSRGSDEAELAWRSLHYMVMMREIEDRIERKLYRQGKILGGVYVGRGQEAIPVGTALLAEPQDILFPSHRDMAVMLIRGMTPRQIFAQYMGRVDGPTRGRDGNMHMGDLSLGLVSIISALAATVPVAAGAALAMRYKGIDGVAFSYFGDGATSRGDWHEGVNFAAVQKLPVLFVCNNNQYAYSTPLSAQMACLHVADKGPAYGIPAEIVDGNDVFAVYEATRRGRVQDVSYDRPFGARRGALCAAGTVRRMGQAGPDPAPGKADDRAGMGIAGGSGCAARRNPPRDR